MLGSNVEFWEEAQRLEKLWVKSYDPGVRRHFEVGKTTLKDLLVKRRAEIPDKPHFIFKGKTWTYEQADAIACKLANALLDAGVKQGECVSLMLPNIPELAFGFMACFKAGFIGVGINPRLTVPEIAYNLNDSHSRTILVDESQIAKINELMEKEERAHIDHVILVFTDRVSYDPSKVGPYPELYDFIDPYPDSEPDVQVGLDDVQVLSYTGGTTGISKGCMYTNRQLVAHAEEWVEWYSPVVKPEEMKVHVSLPMTHAYSITCATVWPIVAGGCAIIGSSSNVDVILFEINQNQANVWPAVPALIHQLITRDNAREMLTSLKLVMVGTAPPTEEMLIRFREVCSGVLIEGYGLSEMVSCVSFQPTAKQKLDCVGLPISNTYAIIVDLDTGAKVVPQGEPGEIITMGPQRIDGYWEHPEETAKTIRDGWLYTGDIGELDEDGMLHIVGRKKNMIIVGGFNVFPRDIDSVLCESPKVKESSTVGIKHSRLGEVAATFVVPADGVQLTPLEVEVYCRKKLTAYKVPKYIKVVDELPRTQIGKPDMLAMQRIASESYVEK